MVALTFLLLTASSNKPPFFMLNPKTESTFILVVDSALANDAKGPASHFAESNRLLKNTDPAKEEDSQKQEDKYCTLTELGQPLISARDVRLHGNHHGCHPPKHEPLSTRGELQEPRSKNCPHLDVHRPCLL
jgi:hypothetical protein